MHIKGESKLTKTHIVHIKKVLFLFCIVLILIKPTISYNFQPLTKKMVLMAMASNSTTNCESTIESRIFDMNSRPIRSIVLGIVGSGEFID